MPEVLTPAASSPVEVVDVFNGQTPTLREFNAYRQSGEVPERFKPAEVAEAATADTPEQTADSENVTDSETEETQEQPHKVSGAEKRIKQLLAENKALKEARQEKPNVVPAPSAVPQFPPTRPEPVRYDANEDGTLKYESDIDFVKDMGRWSAEQTLHESRQRDIQQQQIKQITESIEDARKRYGDEFDNVIEPTAATIMGNKEIPVAVKQMMADSDVLPELVYTIGTDDKTIKELERLSRTNPTQAMRYIATLEAGIRQELAADDSSVVNAPEPKKTSAPPPPKPVTGPSSRGFDVSDDSLSPEEWMRKRNQQVAQRRKT